jgi:cysteine-rich repeat protein
MMMTKRIGAIGLLLAVFLADAAAAERDACGNGVIDAGEVCDDGNRFAGDCCSPECRLEESHLGCAGECLCATCDDGIDNDGDGRADAEDPECATLAALQRYAWIDPGVPTATTPTGDLAVLAVPAPGALAGSAIPGLCDRAVGACVCPEAAADCQAAGRPCARDGECEPSPYPAGESRAWVCDEAASADGPCARAARQVRREIDGIWSLPGTQLELAPATAAVPEEVRFGAGVHVVDIDAVVVDDGAEIVLVGAADTTLVVRVGSTLSVGPHAAVRAGGDLAAERILWVLGPGSALRLGEEARFVGALLADERAQVVLGRGARWDGAALGAAPAPL